MHRQIVDHTHKAMGLGLVIFGHGGGWRDMKETVRGMWRRVRGSGGGCRGRAVGGPLRTQLVNLSEGKQFYYLLVAG